MKEFPATKARQGRKGVRVLVILIISLILALLAWWITDYSVPDPVLEPIPSQDLAPTPPPAQ